MTDQPDRDKAREAAARDECGLFNHDWEDTYYGVRCRKCQMFVPYGHGPWMPTEDDLHEDALRAHRAMIAARPRPDSQQ